MRLKEKVRKRKGRGFGNESTPREPIQDYERVRNDDDDELEPGPQRCTYFFYIFVDVKSFFLIKH